MNTHRHYPGLQVDIVRGFSQLLASALHLPFRNKVFNKTYASHILEHLHNPTLAIKEIIRVTSTYVFIETPHFIGRVAKAVGHVTSFKRSWFKRTLKNYRCTVDSKYRFPRDLYIQVEIWLK